jgi:hypothetical protein
VRAAEVALGLGFAGLMMATPAAGQQAAVGIPALASTDFAWQANGVHRFDPPPGLGRGPIRQDPAHPFHGNLDGPGQVPPDIGDTKDPDLKPWAAKQMQESNDEVLSGKRAFPSWPSRHAIRAAYPGNC